MEKVLLSPSGATNSTLQSGSLNDLKVAHTSTWFRGGSSVCGSQKPTSLHSRKVMKSSSYNEEWFLAIRDYSLNDIFIQHQNEGYRDCEMEYRD